MIEAELHDKLSQDGAGAHERMEDVLTSNVFGLLRYLPSSTALLPWILRARPVGEAPPLQLAPPLDPVFWFWPMLGTGEVDVLLSAPTDDGGVDLVAIECKYESGKSGRAADATPQADGASVDLGALDQLAKYSRGLAGGRYPRKVELGRPVRRRILVYLTDEVVPPEDELRESLGAMDSPDQRKAVYWLSWDRLHQVLKDLDQGKLAPHERHVVSDLLRLLDRKGMRCFSGFERVGQVALPTAWPVWRRLWRDLRWTPAASSMGRWRVRWRGLRFNSVSRRPTWRLTEQ